MGSRDGLCALQGFGEGSVLEQLEEASLSGITEYKELSEGRYPGKAVEQLHPENACALKQG